MKQPKSAAEILALPICHGRFGYNKIITKDGKQLCVPYLLENVTMPWIAEDTTPGAIDAEGVAWVLINVDEKLHRIRYDMVL